VKGLIIVIRIIIIKICIYCFHFIYITFNKMNESVLFIHSVLLLRVNFKLQTLNFVGIVRVIQSKMQSQIR